MSLPFSIQKYRPKQYLCGYDQELIESKGRPSDLMSSCYDYWSKILSLYICTKI